MDAARIDDVARRHGIRLIVQFGSTLHGRVHPRSDLDLAVLLDRVPRSLAAHADLIADLQSLFPDREVDVAIINRADPLFLRQIVERGGPVYGPSRVWHELRMYAFKRYQDHRRYLAMERDYVTRQIQALTR